MYLYHVGLCFPPGEKLLMPTCNTEKSHEIGASERSNKNCPVYVISVIFLRWGKFLLCIGFGVKHALP